jgi:hypothetical protein
VWAVGYRSDPSHLSSLRTLVEHWDGSSWKVVPTPNRPGESENTLDGVCAVPNHPGLLWAVGNDFEAGGTPLILRHSHGHWEIAGPLPRLAPAHFGNLFACASNGQRGGLWAVGDVVVDDPFDIGSYPLMLRRTRTGWHHVAAPHKGFNSGVSDVAWIPGTGQWWAVGYWAGYSGGGGGLVLRYSAGQWRRYPNPTRTLDRQRALKASLRGVVAIGRRDAWAVGSQRSAELPLAEHYH